MQPTDRISLPLKQDTTLNGSNQIKTMSSSANLLGLPLELQERIMCYVLRPEFILEFGESPKYLNDKDYIMRNPLKMLLLRRRSTAICKELYEIGLPAYFRTTALKMAVGDWAASRTVLHLSNALSGVRMDEILFGLFEEDQLLFHNTMKLRVEVTEALAIKKLCEILMKCNRLVEVIVCTHNLNEAEGRLLLSEVTEAVEVMKTRADQNISVRQETAAEYARELEVRRIAAEELRRLERLKWSRSGRSRGGMKSKSRPERGHLSPWKPRSQVSYPASPSKILPPFKPYRQMRASPQVVWTRIRGHVH